MNISIIVAFAALIIAVTPGKNPQLLTEKNDLTNDREILNEFDFSARTITNCSKSECIEGSLKNIRSMKSYLLVYKSTNSWMIEKNPMKRDSVMSKYVVKQIAIASGDIIMNNKAIKEDYLVILNK